MNRSILKRIAKKHGVSVSDVRRDMQFALDETFKGPRVDNSFEDFNGNKPTLEEFINYAKQRVKESP